MILNPLNPEEGIYPGTPEPVYRQARAISQSELKECDYSLAHFQQARTAPKKPPTDDQVTGLLTHALILQRQVKFAVIPPDAPKQPSKSQINAKKPSEDTVAAIKWWDQFRRLNPGKELVSGEDAEKLFAMQKAVMEHPIASEIITRASAIECAGFKKHATGLMMKGLADCISVDDKEFTTIPDLKTVPRGGAKREYFEKSIYDWGYHLQAAHYLDVFGATYFVLIVVEKEPPHSVALYNVEPDSIRIGRNRIDGWMTQIAQCEKTGHWPAYHSGIMSIGIPEWAKRRE